MDQLLKVTTTWENRGNGRHGKARHRPHVLTIPQIEKAYRKAWNDSGSDVSKTSDWFLVIPDGVNMTPILSAINAHSGLTLAEGYPMDWNR